MDNMEDKIDAVLNNPEMMQKIMAMAQSLGGNTQSTESQQAAAMPFPDFDPAILQKISGLARHGNIDKQQQNLLQALNPYLSRQRIQKLENAMRAARMARIAAGALSGQGLKLPTGR